MPTNAKNLAELLNTDSTIAFDDAAANNFEPKFLWETKTSAFNVSASRGYFVDTSGAPVTATLPASPTAGDTVRFVDLSATFDTVSYSKSSESTDAEKRPPAPIA